MPKIINFDEAHAWLNRYAPVKVPRPAYMLEHMQRFMDFLGNPQDKIKVIHVAGTSGKTSTCYYIASQLHEAGKKVGLSVSPYVHDMNERAQIDLIPLPEQQFCSELSEFLGLVKKSDITLTRFELLTAFSYWEFARQGVDYAVMEVGLGGALDATNVVERENKVCVITDIGLDHQHVLGSTSSEIAHNKAGIIQLHNKVVTYRQDQEVMKVIKDRAVRKQADLQIVPSQSELPDTFDFLPLFQRRNFGLAETAVELVSQRDGLKRLSDGGLLRAARAHVPARMETYKVGDKTVILDGAHNEQKMEALAASIKYRYPDKQIAVLAGFKAGPDSRVESASKVLADFADHVMVAGYGDSDNPNGEPYGEDPNVVAALCKVHGHLNVEAFSEPAHAWRQLLRRPEPILLITGSFYMLNEIYPLLGDHVWVHND